MGRAKRWAEEVWARGYGDADGYLCLDHVMDSALALALHGEVTTEACVLCGDLDEVVVSAESLVAAVMDTMRFFFKPSDVLPWDSEDGVYIGPVYDTLEALGELADGAFEGEFADIAFDLLHEAIGDENQWTSWGAEADTDDLAYQWNQFSESVRFESRFIFLGRDASDEVALQFLRKLDDYAVDEIGLVQVLPAGSHLFRGRLCENPSAIESSARELGPAPRGKASANRMSPQGISLFYGSADVETAVAEIAGHGVDPLATMGRFETTRNLTILDLTLRPPLPSPFDAARRREYRMLSFLDSFVEAITSPVIPDGRQHVEYVPTQVVTEYFRRAIRTKLDGLALPSAQTGKRTYVLFADSTDVADSAELLREPSPAARMLGVAPTAPTLILDPSTVTTYRVTRSYGIESDEGGR